MNIVPKGKQLVVAFDHEHGIANTGTAFVRVHLRIVDGAHRNYSLVHDLWLTDDAIEGTCRQLADLGWDGNSLTEPIGLGSKRAVADVEHEWSDERKRFFPRVQWVNKLGSARLSEARQLPAEEVQSLDRKFSEMLRAPAAQQTAPAAPRKAPPDDDDIPF